MRKISTKRIVLQSSLAIAVLLTYIGLIAVGGLVDETAALDGAQAQDQAPAPYISPTVKPVKGKIIPQKLKPSGVPGSPKTVPEGEPLPAGPPPPRKPISDPVIQLK